MNNLLDQVIGCVRSGLSRKDIQKTLGLSMWKTRQLIDQAKIAISSKVAISPGSADEQIKSDLKISKLQKERMDAEEKYHKVLEEMEKSQNYQDEVMEFASALEKAKPHHFAIKDSGKKSQSTAFMIGSDWHIEETVTSEQVNGLNEFNVNVATKRVEKFFENGLKLIEMGRSKSEIDTLVLALLGDLITGYIHEEFVESNSLSPTEASLKVYDLVTGGIDFLLEHGKFNSILVPCCYGNHGRTTMKPRISTGAANSFEWLVYSFLLKHYANHPIVTVKLTGGYFNYLDVYNKVMRMHHGDGINYHGGVGGIHIPLRKSIAQWNKAREADVDVLGHWHTRQSSGDYVVNGSIIGYNSYSIHIKGDYEKPQQSFFLMHPRYGKTVEAPIFVE